jgi:hypothetical protein
MRFDPKKSFGYPVLRRNSDDYVDASITASVDLIPSDSGSPTEFVADYSILVGVPELLHAVKNREVSVVIQFFCPKTFYSDRLITQELRGHKAIDMSGFRGDLLIAVELVICSDEFTLQSSKVHPEFGGEHAKFSLKKGDLVAQPEPLSIHIERESFKPVSSLFKWVQDESIEEGHWQMDTSGDYVNITISPSQEKFIAVGQSSAEGKGILLNAIFLPAVSKLIEFAVKDPDSELLWSKTIIQKLIDMGFDLKKADAFADESIKYAQILLQQPLRRLNAQFTQSD